MKWVWIRLYCVLLCTVALSEHVQARDFHSPAERPVHGTAYTPAAKQKTFTAGVFGSSYSEMLAAIGIAYAPTRFWDFGINLAHLGMGVLNVNTKLNALDWKGFGIGLGVGFLWGHGNWIWALPPAEKALVRGIDMFVFPIQIIGSADATKWLHFDLVLEYNHVEVLGEMSGKHLFYDGAIGSSQLIIRPIARFYLKDRVALLVDGKLPMWGRIREEVASEIRLTDGVKGGVRSAGYRTQKPLSTWLVSAGIEMEVKTGLYVAMNLAVGPYSEIIFRRILHMGIRFEWRF